MRENRKRCVPYRKLEEFIYDECIEDDRGIHQIEKDDFLVCMDLQEIEADFVFSKIKGLMSEKTIDPKMEMKLHENNKNKNGKKYNTIIVENLNEAIQGIAKIRGVSDSFIKKEIADKIDVSPKSVNNAFNIMKPKNFLAEAILFFEEHYDIHRDEILGTLDRDDIKNVYVLGQLHRKIRRKSEKIEKEILWVLKLFNRMLFDSKSDEQVERNCDEIVDVLNSQIKRDRDYNIGKESTVYKSSKGTVLAQGNELKEGETIQVKIDNAWITGKIVARKNTYYIDTLGPEIDLIEKSIRHLQPISGEENK